MQKLRSDFLVDDLIEKENGEIEEKLTDIPITLKADGETYYIDIDGVEWIETKNAVHASVLFEMMRDNITDYMHYEKA